MLYFQPLSIHIGECLFIFILILGICTISPSGLTTYKPRLSNIIMSETQKGTTTLNLARKYLDKKALKKKKKLSFAPQPVFSVN